mmetsp:Transcript_5115/g.7888  ORF Transcript_5115/g.7888 Transcript_5115/m.7888 type:complete len:122 (-) Transcript_5115:156-521(-)
MAKESKICQHCNDTRLFVLSYDVNQFVVATFDIDTMDYGFSPSQGSTSPTITAKPTPTPPPPPHIIIINDDDGFIAIVAPQWQCHGIILFENIWYFLQSWTICQCEYPLHLSMGLATLLYF